MIGGALASLRVDEFWANVASNLNSLGDGATKSPKAWKTYWYELKYKARKRETALRQHARGTGGGPPKKPLSLTEVRILQIVGEVSYAGHPQVQIPLPNLQNTELFDTQVTPQPPLTQLADPSRLQNTEAFNIQVTPQPPSTQSAVPSREIIFQNLSPTPPPPLTPPPESSTDDSVEVGPRSGRTAEQARAPRRPYRRRRYEDPPVWAQRYEEQRLEIDRDRARNLGRLADIAEQGLQIERDAARYLGRLADVAEQGLEFERNRAQQLSHLIDIAGQAMQILNRFAGSDDAA
ncbi:uncharacterized protein LOC123879862 [Maniola jurtina]|uniref:uncharacterized protein LOC123879862 n=1 Tax=Maniola jurtina TaxID=191418 RepID=UPI001E68B2DF|nr:uncharacterized protein LOC123879862 [Maniola jurtina]